MTGFCWFDDCQHFKRAQDHTPHLSMGLFQGCLMHGPAIEQQLANRNRDNGVEVPAINLVILE